MKCPKCGYNSFDYLDNCKKCGKDLLEFKQRYGLKSVLLPGAILAAGSAEKQEVFSDTEAAELTGAVSAGAAGAAAGVAAASAAVNEPVEEDPDGVDFGFDFAADSHDDDDFSFDELFDGAPEEDDVEEALEAPKSSPDVTAGAAVAAPESAPDDEYAFELPDLEDGQDDELEEDFGFDPANIDLDSTDDEGANELEKPKGSGEGSRSPFDLPESSPSVGAPEIQTAVVATSSESPELKQPQTAVSNNVSPETDELPTQKTASSVVAAQTDIPTAVSLAVAGPETEPALLNEPVYAPLGSRFVAFSVDLMVLIVTGFCFVVAGEMAMSGSSGVLPTVDSLINLSIPYFLVLFSLTFGYFTLFHFLTGQTPGKMLTGLRVETISGESVPFAQAFLRSVGGLLQALPLGAGYLLLLLQSERQGWNDQFAGTRVVVVTDSD